MLTKSGHGRHLYYKHPTDLPEGVVLNNDNSGKLGEGIDIRGQGGYVVSPPTAGYNYETSTIDLAIADAPEWLIDLCVSRTADKPQREPVQRVGADAKPGDLWSAATPWADILTADGATLIGPDRHRNKPSEAWCRPGKNPREGRSATLHLDGNPTLYVFTSGWTVNGVTLDAETAYTKFSYLAHTRHNGDFSAAARWCAEQGHTTNTPSSPADLMWNPQPAPQETDNTDGHQPPPGQPWPKFPLNTLPTHVHNMVNEVVATTQTRPCMAAQFALGILSAAALEGKHRIIINPGPNGWQPSLNLYLAVIGGSGEGKSTALKYLRKPLDQIDTDNQNNADEARRRAQSELTVLEKRLNTQETLQAKATGQEQDNIRDQIATIHADITTAKQQLKQRTIVHEDTTTESFVQELDENDGRLSFISSEPGFFKAFNRYSEERNLDPILKAYDGDPIIVTRIGRGKQRIPNARASVLVGIQTKLANKIFNDPELSDRGLIARFQWTWPQTRLGETDHHHARPIQPEPAEQWTQLVTQIATNQPQIMPLDPDADWQRREWANHLENIRVARGDLGPHRFAAAKRMIDAAGRVAGILALCDGTETVTKQQMNRALRICDYWLDVLVILTTGRNADLSKMSPLAHKISEWATNRTRPDDPITIKALNNGKVGARTIDGIRTRPSRGEYDEALKALTDCGTFTQTGPKTWLRTPGPDLSPDVEEAPLKAPSGALKQGRPEFQRNTTKIEAPLNKGALGHEKGRPKHHKPPGHTTNRRKDGRVRTGGTAKSHFRDYLSHIGYGNTSDQAPPHKNGHRRPQAPFPQESPPWHLIPPPEK